MNASLASAKPFGNRADAYPFVDPRVAGRELLARDVPSTIRIAVIDIVADGVAQIAIARARHSAMTARVRHAFHSITCQTTSDEPPASVGGSRPLTLRK